jgi:hypothetical protein
VVLLPGTTLTPVACGSGGDDFCYIGSDTDPFTVAGGHAMSVGLYSASGTDGYAGAGSGAVEQLNSYRAALDRAQAVTAALTQAGIPSDEIQVEAAPAGANSDDSRAEVLLEH